VFSVRLHTLIIGPLAFFKEQIVIQFFRSFQHAFILLALTACQAAAEEKSESVQELRTRIDRQIADWQPTADEKRFDQIGWCTSLLEAEKMAREHHRPIFLFTHDGRMNVGRC
jgi:hypothetical protein